MGDFNEITLVSKVKGGAFVLSRARILHECLDHCGPADLHVVDSKFTWQRSAIG